MFQKIYLRLGLKIADLLSQIESKAELGYV